MLSSFYVNTAECFLIIKIIIQRNFLCLKDKFHSPKEIICFLISTMTAHGLKEIQI